jgi:hypothetical protein
MNAYEYTTVAACKDSRDIQATISSVQDDFILREIRRASKDINDICNRHFAPVIDTHYFDTPGGANLVSRVYARYIADLNMDDDLLELTTLTNGDGTVITSTDYKLYPLNSTPKEKLTLLSSKYVWLPATNGVPNGAVSIVGTWGYHREYDEAWDTVTALAAAITTTTATSTTVPKGLIDAGDLLKIDTEFIYVSAVATGTPNDTLTIVRGVNGSTAAAHLVSAVVYRYSCGGQIEALARSAATAYTLLRSNPMGESVSLDGVNWTTPKDVLKWLGLELASLGLVRIGMG